MSLLKHGEERGWEFTGLRFFRMYQPSLPLPPPPPSHHPSSLPLHPSSSSSSSELASKSAAASLVFNAFTASFANYAASPAANNGNTCGGSPFSIPPAIFGSSPSSASSSASSSALRPSAAFPPPLIGTGKRERTKYSECQLRYLEGIFAGNRYPDGQMREQIARNLQLTEVKVQVWFKNRRAKQRNERKFEQIRNLGQAPNNPNMAPGNRNGQRQGMMKREESVGDTEEENQQQQEPGQQKQHKTELAEQRQNEGGGDVKPSHSPSPPLPLIRPSAHVSGPSSATALPFPYDHFVLTPPSGYTPNSSSSSFSLCPPAFGPSSGSSSSSYSSDMGSLVASASQHSSSASSSFYPAGWSVPAFPGHPSSSSSSSSMAYLPHQFGHHPSAPPPPAPYYQTNNYYFTAAAAAQQAALAMQQRTTAPTNSAE